MHTQPTRKKGACAKINLIFINIFLLCILGSEYKEFQITEMANVVEFFKPA
jgi:hypothetical protein